MTLWSEGDYEEDELGKQYPICHKFEVRMVDVNVLDTNFTIPALMLDISAGEQQHRIMLPVELAESLAEVLQSAIRIMGEE